MVKTRLRLKARIVPVLVAILLVIEILGLYRGWRVLLVGLGLAWLIGFLWARSLAGGLRLKRELRFGWVQVGDRLLERITLRNEGRFPALWVEFHDHSSLPNHAVGRSLSVGGRNSVRWFNDTACSIRGLFNLGPVTIRTGDPFGFYEVELTYPTSVPVLVLPQVVALPTIPLAKGGRAEEGQLALKAIERTVSAGSVREYLPGDYHRWIHWPTTARRNELFVRVFDAAPAGDLWIVLDMCEEVHVGVGEKSTQEHAVVLAASLADRGLRRGRPVGLLSADDELVWKMPRGGEFQRWGILHSLALVSIGNRRLADLLLSLSFAFSHDSSLVVLTPDTDPIWVEALASLTQTGISATVMMLDPQSFGGEGDVDRVRSALVELGVENHLVTRDLLEGAAETTETPMQRVDFMLASAHQSSQEAWEVML
jgi:uncharacterized protein (DUF58 family)